MKKGKLLPIAAKEIAQIQDKSVRNIMFEQIVFKCILGFSLGFWVRGIAFVKSKPDLKDWQPCVGSRRHALALLVFALVLALSSILGLVGMYFEPQFFRWLFLVSIVGKSISCFIYEMNPNRTRLDIFVSFCESIFSGAILAIVFL